MPDIVFKDSLIEALNEYDNILEQMDKLTSEKEEIREKVKKWLEINNIDEFDTKIENDKLYRITNKSQVRKSPNYPYLETVLTSEQMLNAVNVTEYNVLNIKEVKHRKSNNSAIPKAPKAE